MSVLRITRTKQMSAANDEAVVAEVAKEIEKNQGYGTSAPDSNTQGNIYYQIGATAATAVKVFVKVSDTWYGA